MILTLPFLSIAICDQSTSRTSLLITFKPGNYNNNNNNNNNVDNINNNG